MVGAFILCTLYFTLRSHIGGGRSEKEGRSLYTLSIILYTFHIGGGRSEKEALRAMREQQKALIKRMQGSISI